MHPSKSKKENMKRHYLITLVALIIIFAVSIPDLYPKEQTKMKCAPLNPAFMKYQMSGKKRIKSVSPPQHGLIPDPAMPVKHQPSLDDMSDMPNIPLYDLRDPNNDGNLNDTRLTPVRNQLNCGACWSFASFGVLENNLKSTRHLSDDMNDFSENHMRHSHNFDIASCAGGNLKMSAAYFVTNKGPIQETEDPYRPLTDEFCMDCVPNRYIDSIVFLPTRHDIDDIGFIKRAIYHHGAIYSSMYFDENRYYDPDLSSYYYDDPDDSFNDSNHAIVIVGWNDDMEIPDAQGKGAFIVRNSFGSDWGDHGYFYVSYFDESLAFTSLGYIEDHHSFSFKKIYQYDDLGWTGAIGSGDGSDWAANVFMADENIRITGVGFYTTGLNTSCTITIYQKMIYENGYARHSNPLCDPQKSTFENIGYYSIPLSKPIQILSGNSFVVVIHYTGLDNDYGIPIETPVMGYSSKATATENQSFVSDDGSIFFDLTDLSPQSNNCIKAYASPFIESPPHAISQEVHTNEDTAVPITLSGVDQSNTSLNYFLLSSPFYGGLSGQLPELIYTPDPDYFGADGFDFIVNNGTESSESAHVTIYVLSVNDPPKARFTKIQIDEDTSFSLSSIGSDADSDFVYCYIQTPPIHGEISTTFPERIYTPNAHFFGSDSFSFYLNDGQCSSIVMKMDIEINPINDPPLVFDQFISLIEDTQKRLTLQGSDIDSAHLNYSIVTPPKHGGISGISPNLEYAPSPNYSGSDVFSYKANDGQMDSNLAYCHINVQPADDTPTANDMTMTLEEGQSVVFSLSGNDIENVPLTYIIVTPPNFGQITGTLPDLIYSPNTGFTGTDYLTYQVDDGNNLSEKAIIQLIVEPDNELPVVENLTRTIIENTPEPITLSGTDSNNNPLSFSIVKHPEHGEISGVLPHITYTPHENYCGIDKFLYIANDGYSNSQAGQVLLIVKHFNYPPESFSDRIVISKNTEKHLYLKASDKNNDPLNYVIVKAPDHGQISGNLPFVIYTPDIDFTGVDSFSFQVNDGKLNSKLSKIKIIVTSFDIITDSINIDTTSQTFIFEGFEGDTSSWTFGTEGQVNKWFAGDADSYEGTKAAYISQDNGTTATYNENETSESWLGRTVDLSGYINATLSFYWKSVGERFIVWCDYGEFYINNGSDILTSDSKEFIDNNSWTKKTFDLSAYVGNQIEIKFRWKNDGSQKEGDPPFSIDNVEIAGSQMKPGAGNALDFDGSNDYVALSDGTVSAESLAMPATITVEAWVKVDSFINWAAIVGFIYDDGLLEGGWVLGVKMDNKFYFGITTESGSYDYINYLETGDDYLTDTWYHIAGTYDGSTMRVYVNGVEAATRVHDYGGNIYYRNTYFAIGSYLDNTDNIQFDGQIDAVRIWNGARSSDEIRANMCKKIATDVESNLLYYYHLDHSQGVLVNDYVSGKNNGVLKNMDSEDWVISGAAIGDSTIYDYNGITASDFEVSLSHPDGDQFTATGESGNYSGLHLYLINDPPNITNTDIECALLDQNRHWGIFPVGIGNLSFEIKYQYTGNPIVNLEDDLKMLTRENQSYTEWSALTSTQNKNLDTLYSTENSVGEFILGTINLTPSITQGDTISTIIDKNCWPRAWNTPIITASDADNDPLTWTIFSGSSHGTLVVSGTGVSPSVQYTPNQDYVGYDSFVIQVDDGHEYGTDTITINVEIAPGINARNLPYSTPNEGASSVVRDNNSRIILYHMGPGRMIMPPVK